MFIAQVANLAIVNGAAYVSIFSDYIVTNFLDTEFTGLVKMTTLTFHKFTIAKSVFVEPFLWFFSYKEVISSHFAIF